ncbi:hypothetical protein BX600DRAFT_456101 [Xylariales sp. PMI_506]|nr:hypothetical protein BX600DRAFT_456101 [Xylariales sp. PMI_506]
MYKEGTLKEITQWIQNCTNLKELSLTNFKDALLILKDVLNTPAIQLISLSLQGFSSLPNEVGQATWAALGLQSSLERLSLGGPQESLVIHEMEPLAASICSLKNLKALNLTQASVRTIELRQIVMALPGLAELSFGGDWVDDVIFEFIVSLKSLNVLMINASSVFTYPAFMSFLSRLDTDTNRGITIDIVNQLGQFKMSDEDHTSLTQYIATVLSGRLEIGYLRDPDEEHESDFSDDSD